MRQVPGGKGVGAEAGVDQGDGADEVIGLQVQVEAGDKPVILIDNIVGTYLGMPDRRFRLRRR